MLSAIDLFKQNELPPGGVHFLVKQKAPWTQNGWRLPLDSLPSQMRNLLLRDAFLYQSEPFPALHFKASQKVAT